MPECLPGIPAGSTIRQNPDGSWQYRRRSVGPWRPIPAPQSGLPWPTIKTDGPAVLEGREPASVAAEARPLGPAAQAVLDAFWKQPGDRSAIAAALRAAADQADAANVPNYIQDDVYWPYRNGRAAATEHLRDIAAELEGING